MPVTQKNRDKLRKAAKVHRIIADVADDPNVLAALDDLTDSAEERKRAAADIDQWVKDKKIKLPQGSKVTFKEDNWSIELDIPWAGEIWTIGYDSDDGLYSAK